MIADQTDIVQPSHPGFSDGDQIGALVTGADYRGLGVMRSLGRRGIPVCVLKRPGHHLAAVSKYARKIEVWPPGDEAQGVDFILNLAERKGLKGWVLIPTDDEVVGLVARHHDLLAKQFRLTIPPWDKLSWGCDKRQLNKLARELKVDQPWTVCPRDREEVAQLQCSFPVIIKPALREAYNPLTAAKAWPVVDRPSLIARYDEARSMMAPELIMIQEVIPGWGEAQFSYAALCQDGRPLASVVARRTRQYPMDFGQFSTYVETIDDPGVVQPSVRLLEAARYTGLVEVEFKRDPRDGRFKLLDVNPRVWGWHTLGSRVGVDFSYLLWLMVRGEAVPEVHGGPGGRWIRMNTDVPVAILEILRGRISLREYLRSLNRAIEGAVFAADDPFPGLLETPMLIFKLLKRFFRSWQDLATSESNSVAQSSKGEGVPSGTQEMAQPANEILVDYYRCPVEFAEFGMAGNLCQEPGYFRFGANGVCYGRSSSGFRAKLPATGLYDTVTDVEIAGSMPKLPFDPVEVIENLRLERYVGVDNGSKEPSVHAWTRNTYYAFRDFLPASWRRAIQRRYFRGWERLPFPKWPIDLSVEWIIEALMALSLKARGVEKIPFIWFWPDGFQSCVIVTHDVETLSGRDSCSALMDLDDSFGIKASFQIVPEGRYPVSEEFLNSIRGRGFEINVHDYNHDGRLYAEREEFLRRARRINEFARRFGAAGFRSGTLYRNLDWYDAFEFSYDMSVPNVAHLEVQRGGCCTVMPYFIGKILEIPLTTAQDYSVFYILGKNSIETWKTQLDLIIEKHGLASFNVHPDYQAEEKTRKGYRNLLEDLSRTRAERRLWMALPGEVDRWWRQRSEMRLVKQENGWRIEGNGKERARIAYAALCDDRLTYSVEGSALFNAEPKRIAICN